MIWNYVLIIKDIYKKKNNDMKLCINNKRYLQKKKNKLVPLSIILDVLSMIPLYDPFKF